MELKWLEDYIAVARTRNFSAAATVRHATQSAVSRRIRALENWYGLPLVDRSTYPVTLTSAGVQFLPLAERVVEDLQRSRADAQAARDRSGREVRIAMPHSLAGDFFSRWWRTIPGHDDICASVIAADFNVCMEMLVAASCHFLICYGHEAVPLGMDDDRIRCLSIGSDRLVPVSRDRDAAVWRASSSGLTSTTTNTARPALLAYTSTSFLGRITRLLQPQWPLPVTGMTVRMESTLVGALKAAAILGEGLAWLPESLIRHELESRTLCDLRPQWPAAELEILLCTTQAIVGDTQGWASRIWARAACGQTTTTTCGQRTCGIPTVSHGRPSSHRAR